MCKNCGYCEACGRSNLAGSYPEIFRYLANNCHENLANRILTNLATSSSSGFSGPTTPMAMTAQELAERNIARCY